MRIHVLQHVPFEDAAQAAVWAERNGHPLTATQLYAGDALPAHDAYDLLMVMGGPMNVYEHDKYPWLVAEKKFIREALDGGKALLGVCLGGQLMADVLGGPVTRNPFKEIGWFPVRMRAEAQRHALLADWPEQFTAFHWHGDTFAIPPEAEHLASSGVCAGQGFLWGDRALGLQFHLEYTEAAIRTMLKECDDELESGGICVQSPHKMIEGLGNLAETHRMIESTLAAFEKLIAG